ncbi:MAG TPA: alpha-ketoglutarate-dependent dioxygenase AlkB [Flavobacterium sp.]|jgi:alkylated DNA repair dioxygenase AlkB
MNLFDDTELFSTGNHGKETFNLPDTEMILYNSFFDKAEADWYYKKFLDSTPWEEYDMTIYGKSHTVPRMIAWYEDKTNPGASPSRPDWTPELLAIRKRVEVETGLTFNSVLLNLYRNGNDGVGWHSDREENFGKDAVIGSVTFGQTRPFRMRHKFRKDILPIEIPLHHGSFLLMGGTTQSFWEHHIPKTSKNVLPRINLTFRQVKRKLPV